MVAQNRRGKADAYGGIGAQYQHIAAANINRVKRSSSGISWRKQQHHENRIKHHHRSEKRKSGIKRNGGMAAAASWRRRHQ